MEARREQLEEVQSEAEGEEAEEEGLWVSGYNPLQLNLWVKEMQLSKLRGRMEGEFFFLLVFVLKPLPFFLVVIVVKVRNQSRLFYCCLLRNIRTTRRQIFGTGHGVREHLRCLKPESLLFHFYLLPWSPESRTPVYCLALIQRREDIHQPIGWNCVGCISLFRECTVSKHFQSKILTDPLNLNVLLSGLWLQNNSVVFCLVCVCMCS